MVETGLATQIVTGFFAHDDPAADGRAIGALPARFGLLDDSPDRWDKFRSRISELNAAASARAQYKVFYLSRHGQGIHNLAEAKYGSKAWDDHWSKLNDNGELIWGPDPKLTNIGIEQAIAARDAWKTEHTCGMPFPQRHYASPLQRALDTFHETFVNESLVDEKTPRCMILENLREEHGEHTCDLRSPRSVIAQKYPPPIYGFEDGFTEEDVVWKADERETKRHVAERARSVLDRIFSLDEELYICITAHSGIINGILATMGRSPYPLPTGGILPLVIKAVNV